MPLAAGTKLGPYEILAPMGAGGMGEVYKARDPQGVNRECHMSTHSSGGVDGVPSTTFAFSLIFILQFVHPVRVLVTLLLFLLPAASLRAQGNYEVQVYGSEMVPPARTMVELHSNFTFEGSKTEVDGIRPDNHALHETIEITQGFTSWFETGFYIFMSYRTGEGYQWVGDHIRPRVRIPEVWHWPVNVSLSTEIGYQRRSYSPDTWTWEIRPIIDKQLDRWYLAFNPAVDRSFHGLSVSKGVTFAPDAKVGFDVTKRVSMGFEYYGDLGSITGFDPLREQVHAIMPAIDLNLGPNWEFNFATGIGLTSGTDHLLVKMILGRRFKFGKR